MSYNNPGQFVESLLGQYLLIILFILLANKTAHCSRNVCYIKCLRHWGQKALLTQMKQYHLRHRHPFNWILMLFLTLGQWPSAFLSVPLPFRGSLRSLIAKQHSTTQKTPIHYTNAPLIGGQPTQSDPLTGYFLTFIYTIVLSFVFGAFLRLPLQVFFRFWYNCLECRS